MKISYSNLEGFYLTKKGVLIKGNHVYIEKDSCKKCGEPFLTLKLRPSNYCCLGCGRSGKKRFFTKEHCKNLSVALTGKHPSKETRQKKSASMKGKFKGKKNPMFGKIVSSAVRNKISVTQIRRYQDISPQDCPNFIHGLSKTRAHRTMLETERRLRKRGQTPQLTVCERKKIHLLYEKCFSMNAQDCLYQVDHIRPLSKGGQHHPDNLQVLSRSLNMEKSNKYPLTRKEEIRYAGIRV